MADTKPGCACPCIDAAKVTEREVRVLYDALERHKPVHLVLRVERVTADRAAAPAKEA